MSRPPAPASRRTAITLALAAPLVLAACDLDPPSAAPPESPPPAPPRPDTEVVAAARKAILLMVATIEATTAAHLRLRAGLGPWLDLHGAHLAVLDDGAEDQAVEPALVDPRPPAALRAVIAAEAALSASLADSSRLAASGDLARALASMSAAVTQRLVT